MQNIYTIASSSASTTYGNIMTFVKERLQQLFMIGVFKDVNLSSEIAYVNVRRRLGRNTTREMTKLERPHMVITPRIDVPSNDMYLYDIPLTKNFDNMEYGVDANTLFCIINNQDDGYSLNYKLNRDRIQFDVTITMDTMIQYIDLYKYVLNHFVWERPFTVNASLESMIPREMIKHMCFLSNIDIDDERTNQIPISLKMMNRYTRYPITYKIRNGTALDEFFMYYNAHILLTFDNLSLDGGNKKGFTDDYYQIRFQCTADFNLPGAYILMGSKPRPRQLDVSIQVKEEDGYHDLIPLFTINNFYSRYPATRNGYLYYTSTKFQTDCPENVTVDRLDLTCLFEQWQIDIIHQYAGLNIPMSTLIDPLLIKYDTELTSDWHIDWNKMELVVENADNKATYCLILYVNNNLFNEEKIDSTERSMQDKPRL